MSHFSVDDAENRTTDEDGENKDHDEWEPLDTNVTTNKYATPPCRKFHNQRSSKSLSAAAAAPPPPPQSAPSVSSAAPSISCPPQPDIVKDHPIKLVYSYFLIHFCRELWYLNAATPKTKRQLRLALVGGLLSIVSNVLFASTTWMWCSWWIVSFAVQHPTLVVTLIFMLMPWIYIMWMHHADVSLPSFFAAERHQLARQVFLFLLFLPTLLEMKTLHFLSSVIVFDGDNIDSAPSESAILSSLGCFAVIVLILSTAPRVFMRYVKFNTPLREYSYRGLLLLFGLAWFKTLFFFQSSSSWSIRLWRLTLLSPPFFTATTVLLFKSLSEEEEDQWLAKTIRQALRLTLRDVLVHVGEVSSTTATLVEPEELLQLAMLRWIVDYWSSSSSSSPSSCNKSSPTTNDFNSTINFNSTTNTATNTATNSATATKTTTAASASAAVPSTTNTTVSDLVYKNNSSSRSSNDAITWSDLLPMLSVTANQMEKEADGLQQQQRRDKESVEVDPPLSSPSTLSPSSFESLRAMLVSMDLDDRAKPAVLAYKRSVENFPPSKPLALVVSIVRRCPAVLLLGGMWLLFFLFTTIISSTTANATSPIAVSFILLPFAVIELLRVKLWIQTCERVAAASSITANKNETCSQRFWASLQHLDPMFLLLCYEDQLLVTTNTGSNKPCCYDSSSSSLLIVWRNVEGSVQALESALTTARCVQTTMVAADFASNIMSLVNFGAEIQERGWFYGVSVLLHEVLTLHDINNNINSISTTTRVNSTTTTTPKNIGAALSAWHNSKRLSQNISALFLHHQGTAHDNGAHEPKNKYNNDNIGTSIVLAILSIVVGKGWLWGRGGEEDGNYFFNQQHDSFRPHVVVSSVQIEELDDDDDAAEQQSSSSLPPPQTSSRSTSSCNAQSETNTSSVTAPSALKANTMEVFDIKLSNYDHKQELTVRDDNDNEEKKDGGAVAIVAADKDAKEGQSKKNVIELIASCAEANLIDEDERESLLVRIEKSTSAPNGVIDAEEVAWIEATGRSLQALLSQEENEKSFEPQPIIVRSLEEEDKDSVDRREFSACSPSSSQQDVACGGDCQGDVNASSSLHLANPPAAKLADGKMSLVVAGTVLKSGSEPKRLDHDCSLEQTPTIELPLRKNGPALTREAAVDLSNEQSCGPLLQTEQDQCSALLMELIASCVEANLIDEPERISLCERIHKRSSTTTIAGVTSEDEKKNDSSDEEAAWMKATCRSLQSLLLSQEQDVDHQHYEPITSRACDGVMIEEEDQGAFLPLSRTPANNNDDNNDYAALSLQEDVIVDTSWIVHATGSSLSSDPSGEGGGNSSSNKTSLVHDQDFKTLSSCAESYDKYDGNGIAVNEAMDDDDVHKNDNTWLQVGGGLAVFGAVLGGVAAVAMMQNNNDKNTENDRRREEDKRK